MCSSDDGRRVVDKTRVTERYHGPANRIIDTERVSTKKSKVKPVSPKRRHLKRPPSPEKSRRAEPSTPVPIKRKDKAEKVKFQLNWKLKLFREYPDKNNKNSSLNRFELESK